MADHEETIQNSGVLFAARESVRAALGTTQIDINVDLRSIFSSPLIPDPKDQRHVADWFLAQDTGYSSSMRSAFFGLCKFKETAAFFRGKFCAQNPKVLNIIDVEVVPADESHQTPDVACYAAIPESAAKAASATAPVAVLHVTFSLRVSREKLKHAHDMHRLEHAIAEVYSPEYKTQRLLGRVNHSRQLPHTRDLLRQVTGNKNLDVDFGWSSITMMSIEDQTSASDWLAGRGYYGTMTGAFSLLCRVPIGREVLGKFEKVSVTVLSGSAGQPNDVVTDVRVASKVLFVTFWLRTGVYLRSSIDSHKLENSIVGALPQLKSGHTRERILGSGELDKVRVAIVEATGGKSSELDIDMNVDTIIDLEKDDRKHATQWIIGEDWTIRGEQRRIRAHREKQQEQRKEKTGNGDDDNHDEEEEEEEEDTDATSPLSSGSPKSVSTAAAAAAAASTNNDDSSSVSGSLTQKLINRRHPSPMLNTIKVAFSSLCKFKSGREELAKFKKIRINVQAATESQPSDVICAVEVDQEHFSIDFSFTLRTSRELIASSDSLQLARKISLALPQLQRGRETEMITSTGNLEELQDVIRERMSNYHLLFDVDFWSITTLEPDYVRADVIKWICGQGLDATLRNGFKALMRNSCGMAVFDKFRRLEITCAVTHTDASLRDIVSCTATTANLGNIVGVVKRATAGARAAPAPKGELEPGFVGSSWKRLPALNLQFVFRVLDRNIRSDYDCSQKLEQAVLGAIPELKRAHDKDLIDASSRLGSVQREINEALFFSSSTSKGGGGGSSSAASSSSLQRRGSRFFLNPPSLNSSMNSASHHSLSSSRNNQQQQTSASADSPSSSSSATKKPVYDPENPRVSLVFDYEDVLSLQDRDLMHAMAWITTESAFAGTMRLAFTDLSHNELFTSTFQDYKKIVIHAFARWVPPEDAAKIKQKHLERTHSMSNTMSKKEDVTFDDKGDDMVIAVPGAVVFEAAFMKPSLHLNFVFCRGDSDMPPLTCEARRLERAILAAAREVSSRH